MAARLSALRAGRFLPTGRFLVLIFVRGWVDPRAIVRLKELGKMKKFHLIRDMNRRPSALQHSASTNSATACPLLPFNTYRYYFQFIVKNLLLNTDSVCLKFLRYNLKVSHHRHVCDCGLEKQNCMHYLQLCLLSISVPDFTRLAPLVN
jgi:hypothetical protein